MQYPHICSIVPRPSTTWATYLLVKLQGVVEGYRVNMNIDMFEVIEHWSNIVTAIYLYLHLTRQCSYLNYFPKFAEKNIEYWIRGINTYHGYIRG